MTHYNEEQIIERLEALSELELPTDQAAADLQAVRHRLELHEPPVPTNNRFNWRIMMNHKLTRLAAMIVLVIGGIGIFSLMNQNSPLAFADVVQPILEARNAVFKIKIGDSPVIEDRILDNRISRTLETVPWARSVIDLQAGQILSLDSRKNQAVYMDLEGLPEGQALTGVGNNSYLDLLRNLIQMLQDSGEFNIEQLGLQVFDGRELQGFRADHPLVSLTIWADPETSMPVRVEQTESQMTIVCFDMKFDVEMDASLFSMEAPEGYTVQETSLDLAGGDEAAFIEFLRTMAQVYDGRFPEDVSIEHFVKQSAALEETFSALDMSDEEKLALSMKIQQGLLFIRFYDGASPWTYTGAGVELGDADTPIFRYQPADNESYRVIYGDLTVEEVGVENLPVVE